MILIEYLWKFIKALFYYTVRPIVWLLTARDCKRCKHFSVWGYCTLKNWSNRTKCKDSVHRCHFERWSWFI